jgi:hypothetical protein
VSAIRAYRQPSPFAGRVSLMLPSEEWSRSEDRPLDWRHFTKGGLEVLAGPQGNDGNVMLGEPYVGWAAEHLVHLIDRASSTGSAGVTQ